MFKLDFLLSLTVVFLGGSLGYIYLRHGFSVEPSSWLHHRLDLNVTNTCRLTFYRRSGYCYDFDIVFPGEPPEISNLELQQKVSVFFHDKDGRRQVAGVAEVIVNPGYPPMDSLWLVERFAASYYGLTLWIPLIYTSSWLRCRSNCRQSVPAAAASRAPLARRG